LLLCTNMEKERSTYKGKNSWIMTSSNCTGKKNIWYYTKIIKSSSFFSFLKMVVLIPPIPFVLAVNFSYFNLLLHLISFFLLHELKGFRREKWKQIGKIRISKTENVCNWLRLPILGVKEFLKCPCLPCPFKQKHNQFRVLHIFIGRLFWLIICLLLFFLFA
jgi:hypothetical protein